MNDIWEFDFYTKMWKEWVFDDKLPARRFHHIVGSKDGFFLLGGVKHHKQYMFLMSDFYRFQKKHEKEIVYEGWEDVIVCTQ